MAKIRPARVAVKLVEWGDVLLADATTAKPRIVGTVSSLVETGALSAEMLAQVPDAGEAKARFDERADRWSR